MKKWLMGLLVVSVLLVGIYTIGLAENPKILRWALIPSDLEAIEFPRWDPIREYLEEKLGIKVDMKICTSNSAALLALKYGHAEMAYLSAFTVVLGVYKLDMDLDCIVRSVKKSTGRDGYYGLILVPKGSDIETLQDLKGKTFAFVNPASTSGCLVPKVGLIDAGIDPEKDFAEVFYAGGHQAVITAISAGQVDAGTANDNRLLDAIEKGAIAEGDLVVIWKSTMIYNPPIVVMGNMDLQFKQRLKEAWLDMPEELAIRTGPKALRWISAKTEDYNFAYDLANKLGLNLEKVE